MSAEIERELRERGWERASDGAMHPPASATPGHIHSAACTAESCGPDTVFVCGTVCRRAARKGIRSACGGHRVPSRAALVEHALRRKGLTQSAPRGAPLEDDDGQPNTWSAER